MDLTNSNGSSKIKRRNFFLYLGATVFGIFSLSKSPLNLFKSKINREIDKSTKLSVKANPDAVMRKKGVNNA